MNSGLSCVPTLNEVPTRIPRGEMAEEDGLRARKTALSSGLAKGKGSDLSPQFCGALGVCPAPCALAGLP
jgi:hypothetical protein